jgi:hypothetical protein
MTRGYGRRIGADHGERGDSERDERGGGRSFNSFGGYGYPYGYNSYGGYGVLDLPAGRVLDPYGYNSFGSYGYPYGFGGYGGYGYDGYPFGYGDVGGYNTVSILGQDAAAALPPPPSVNVNVAPPVPQFAPSAASVGPAWPHPFPPRAAIVNAPMPTQANRDILPMSTGVPILPTQSAQITGRPQTLVFKIGRFVISNAGTAGGSADWIVNDIKIGNRSQFVQSGDVPGDLFATNAIDTFVRFESAQTAMDVVVVVTYIGLNESGAPFFGAMVGTAAV